MENMKSLKEYLQRNEWHALAKIHAEDLKENRITYTLSKQRQRGF